MINKTFLVLGAYFLTLGELGEDPHDLFSNYLLKTATNLSISTQHFVAFYLFSHGIVKLFVIIGLLRKKYWAYPASIAVFSGFIVYQLYRYSHTHSFWLLVFTVFDIIVIYLTIHEWRTSKK